MENILSCDRYGHLEKVWNLVKELLPEFKLPEMVGENAEGKTDNGSKADGKQDDSTSSKDCKKEEKAGKEKDRESKCE